MSLPGAVVVLLSASAICFVMQIAYEYSLQAGEPSEITWNGWKLVFAIKGFAWWLRQP